ncbi:MAG TPA: alkaline phosphatase D family protein [Solirubrobacteraceae bacterium]
MKGARVSRREVLVAGAAAGAALALQRTAAVATARRSWSRTLDFAAAGDGLGWPGWTSPGVANLHRGGGVGVLEAGSDVFPCDPRPVAFAVDQRFRDGEVGATFTATGAGAGLVLRRVGPRDYYAAVVDDEEKALLILRRTPAGAVELARTEFDGGAGRVQLTFGAQGAHPTTLTAATDSGATVSVVDGARPLQRAGDPGVLATARTLFPSEGGPVLPSLGNLHLLPYGVQEGAAVTGSPLGQEVMTTIRERSTAALEEITIRASGRPRRTAPSVVAATTGAPLRGGAVLRVATDVPARVEIELSRDPRFRRSRRVRVGPTNDFGAVLPSLAGFKEGRTVHWRARLRRGGVQTVGPARSFRVLPKAGSPAGATIAIGACASQFGPSFDQLAARAPDLFVWQGDLNYPDTVGPLAQSVSGYAGIWRDFLANPRMAPIFERALFAVQRDDHDYGVQDANSTNLVPWGLEPWEGLMERRHHYRFSAGLADFWVLDQRRFKTDPEAEDTPDKTLLGAEQREWLLRTLAASRAPFKVVCSPCTLAPLKANARDGSWASGFTAERDLLLAHVREHVAGRTIFVTGDTHWTMVYDRDGLFEARPCPLGIPTPNDITLTDPNAAEDARRVPGVVYADDDRGHFALVEVSGSGDGGAQLDLTLVRDDGEVPFRTRFEQALP